MFEHYNLYLYVWTAVGLITFVALLKIKAPYGRHIQTGWGPVIDNRLGWVFMEIPTLFVYPIIYFTSPAFKDDGSGWNGLPILLIGLWFVHYINRTIIFPLRTKTKGKKIPLVIPVFGFFFNCINGAFLGYFFGYMSNAGNLRYLSEPMVWVGLGIFLFGMAVNIHSDGLLIQLRRKNGKGYFIPYGGMFRWVSAPNHFGEIVEWTGFAIMAWNLPAFSFLVWTFANLMPRALAHHKWYQKEFKDYPKNRKAVFPFWV